MLTTRQKMDVVHRAWRYRLKTESDEIALVRDLVNSGDVVLDIGAHKGAFTYWMGKSVGQEGQVVAFEPIPELVEYLQDSIDWLKLNIEVFPHALSDQSGHQKLYFPGYHMGSASLESDLTNFQEPIEISKQKLDDILLDRRDLRPVSFIKCDVEQHEFAVFRGGREVLSQDRPVLLFESGNLNSGLLKRNPAFEFLESIEFEGFFFYQGGLVRLSDFDPDQHILDGDAYQNFVFSHPGSISWESKSRPYRVIREDRAVM